MDYNFEETLAKEITLAVFPRVQVSGDTRPEAIGKYYGQLYKTILKEVIEGHKSILESTTPRQIQY